MMSESALKQRAADYLLANNVKAILPKFSIADVTLAKKREVSIFTKIEDVKEDNMDGPGVSKYSLFTLRQLIAKCSFTLQATWIGAPDERMDQNHFTYTHMRHPQPGELIHVVGKTTLAQNGINQLTFEDNVKVTYGSGSSSMTSYCTEESAEEPIILTASNEAGRDNLTVFFSTPPADVLPASLSNPADVLPASLSNLKQSSSLDTSTQKGAGLYRFCGSLSSSTTRSCFDPPPPF